MKRILAIAALSAVLSTTGFAAEMTGYISDDACALKSAKAASAADWINPSAFEDCAKKCVKEGSTAVFVTEDNKVLRLDPRSSAKVMPLLGHRVKLTGTEKGGTLTVDTIAAIAMKPKTTAKGRRRRTSRVPIGDPQRHAVEPCGAYCRGLERSRSSGSRATVHDSGRDWGMKHTLSSQA